MRMMVTLVSALGTGLVAPYVHAAPFSLVAPKPHFVRQVSSDGAGLPGAPGGRGGAPGGASLSPAARDAARRLGGYYSDQLFRYCGNLVQAMERGAAFGANASMFTPSDCADVSALLSHAGEAGQPGRPGVGGRRDAGDGDGEASD